MDIKEVKKILFDYFMTTPKKEVVEFVLDIITDGYPNTAIKYAKKIKGSGILN